MKQLLTNIADKLAARVTVFKESFPRTQSTDAMVNLGTELILIIRSEAEQLDDGVDLSDTIAKEITAQLAELTLPAKVAGKSK